MDRLSNLTNRSFHGNPVIMTTVSNDRDFNPCSVVTNNRNNVQLRDNGVGPVAKVFFNQQTSHSDLCIVVKNASLV